uniref:RNA-directed DNA polymerase n=1 Tax=Chenopodium quinoa TaxID=63459 RepID=A0A803N8Q4_CHEQI
MKDETRKQFLPNNTSWVARDKLKDLKHTNTIREYVKQFMSLMLDIGNMSEEDKLFQFMSGLKPWAQTELRRQKVQDLNVAIVAAEALVDWKPSGGPHIARNCPKRQQLSALLGESSSDEEDSRENEQEEEDVAPRMNTMKIVCAAIKGEQKEPVDGLMYCRVTVNGSEMWAMIDTGATHNFLKGGLVRKMGLKVQPSSHMIKTVNSAAADSVGIVKDVFVKMGAWKGKVEFLVVEMDDYELVLGNKYFKQAKLMVAPHLGGVVITDEAYPCFVPGRLSTANVTSTDSLLSAMQVKKGIKRGESTFLATLVEIKKDAIVEISKGRVRMDENKVKAIVNWEQPKLVPELRSFLGLANYYRKFIKGYSQKVAPLTDLLKKGQAWAWSDKCEDAFNGLKLAISSKLVLKLPEFDKSFEVHNDALGRAIGGVLVQDGHPIAFEGRKLKEAEEKYSAHEKEMLAVVHCLRTWRHYRLGTKFTVLTDNVANTFFQSQKTLSPKQARWMEFLEEYDFAWQYKPGRHNCVPDALSRKTQEVFAALTSVQSDFTQRVRDECKDNAEYVKLCELVKEGSVRRYWLENGLLLAQGGRLYVPSGKLRQELLSDASVGEPTSLRSVASQRHGQRSDASLGPWCGLVKQRNAWLTRRCCETTLPLDSSTVLTRQHVGVVLGGSWHGCWELILM